jgi:hypothetical protein
VRFFIFENNFDTQECRVLLGLDQMVALLFAHHNDCRSSHLQTLGDFFPFLRDVVDDNPYTKAHLHEQDQVETAVVLLQPHNLSISSFLGTFDALNHHFVAYLSH